MAGHLDEEALREPGPVRLGAKVIGLAVDRHDRDPPVVGLLERLIRVATDLSQALADVLFPEQRARGVDAGCG